MSRFRVYHLYIDGSSQGVVPSWRLFNCLRDIKVLNAYAKISQLRDGAWFELSTFVHGRPLKLGVKIALWAIISNPRPVSSGSTHPNKRRAGSRDGPELIRT